MNPLDIAISSDLSKPALSCIVTAYAEGHLATVAIDSILAQSFNDFELLIVDDGADEQTRRVLHRYDDPRIMHIRQANDGLSSARNRALSVARGDYICFLDADDSRPAWAFATMMEKARSTDADVVFTSGLLSELRNEVHPFYDHDILCKLNVMTQGVAQAGSSDFTRLLPYLVALEPQSANKLVKRSFLERHKLRFPAGLFFEDLVFHMGLILNLDRVATVSIPCFTYFRRYGRPQITSSRGMARFDAIGSAANALGLLQHSIYFHDQTLRLAALGSVFKLLQWCEESVAHNLKWAYREALRAMVANLDPRLHHIEFGSHYSAAIGIADWMPRAIDYFLSLSQPQSSDPDQVVPAEASDL